MLLKSCSQCYGLQTVLMGRSLDITCAAPAKNVAHRRHCSACRPSVEAAFRRRRSNQPLSIGCRARPCSIPRAVGDITYGFRRSSRIAPVGCPKNTLRALVDRITLSIGSWLQLWFPSRGVTTFMKLKVRAALATACAVALGIGAAKAAPASVTPASCSPACTLGGSFVLNNSTDAISSVANTVARESPRMGPFITFVDAFASGDGTTSLAFTDVANDTLILNIGSGGLSGYTGGPREALAEPIVMQYLLCVVLS
jgi:hypothetical protein